MPQIQNDITHGIITSETISDIRCLKLPSTAGSIARTGMAQLHTAVVLFAVPQAPGTLPEAGSTP